MSDQLFSQWASESREVRKNIVKMIHYAASGHPGGSLSMVEILFSLLAAGGVMKHNPAKPEELDRDRLVLSKGHGVPALYALYHHCGYDITSEELMTLRVLESRLQGHPDRVRIPYLEASTGSLGQGVSFAQGLAMGYKLNKIDKRVYCIVGDGEMQEGQIWEAGLSIAHHKVNNLTIILDYNKAQIDGFIDEVTSLEPLKEKWQAFGFHTHEVDGHSYQELSDALRDIDPAKPSIIIAHTIKGCGVPYMEGLVDWHGKAPNSDELEEALKSIDANSTIGVQGVTNG
jgi:transketolase